MTEIRYIIGRMPFDRNGVHATGREVWGQAAAGNWCWQDAYECDNTCDLPVTETDEEYSKRWIEMMIPDDGDDGED